MKTSLGNRVFASAAQGLGCRIKLSHGGELPWLGLGVYQAGGDAETARIVRAAVELGYRSFDTAALYGNERGVGTAVATCGVPRGELFVTTKVWNDDMRQDRVMAAFEESLSKLGLDYVDLYLLHWPIRGKIVQSWQVLEQIHRTGRAKAIGVSNFMIPHLDELLAAAEIVPAVNQIEFHPYLQSRPLCAHCQELGIQVQAWGPLMQGGAILKDPLLAKIAATHGKTAAQVVLRWELQSGVVSIPKSAKAARLAENAGVFSFALSEAEMKLIDQLDQNRRSGADPFSFGF